MAVSTDITISDMDAADESLVNALWFIRNRRYMQALYSLQNALHFARDLAIRDRIQAMADALGNAPLASLA